MVVRVGPAVRQVVTGSAMRLGNLVPRFSLRTLVIFLLLVTSATGLWWHWAPWYRAQEFKISDFGVDSVRFRNGGGRLELIGYRLTDKLDLNRSRIPASFRLVYEVDSGSLLSRGPASYQGTRLLPRPVAPPGDLLHHSRPSPDGVRRLEMAFSPGWGIVEDGPPARIMAAGCKSVKIVGMPSGRPLADLTFPASIATDVRYGAAFATGGWALAICEVNPKHAVENGRTVARTPDTRTLVWRRRRPEWWWGVFYLWEFWLTAAFAALFAWSVWRDRKSLRLAPA